MNEATSSRRSLLKYGGAAFAGAALGIGGWEAVRNWSGNTPADGPEAPAPPHPARIPPVIDVHVHLVNTNLPGIPEEEAPEGSLIDAPPGVLARAMKAQMQAAGVEHALCMPRREVTAEDPLGIARTQQLAALLPGIHLIGLADPERFDEAHLERVEQALEQRQVAALKAYLGYLHHGPDSPGYKPYYRLAGRYQIPVIFHSGDTYSHVAKVKYAHPLGIDDVAVDFPETDFVIAHIGNPWMMDTAEVIYKNNKPGFKENVWADLSGLLVGTAAQFEEYRQQGVFKTIAEDVRKAIEFSERPDRFLFGSDWPLAPLDVYRDFVLELVPEPYHQAVFYDNARALFKLSQEKR
jgi:predicted TIM-barrel fold metal-dependent hydrolase